MKLIIDIPKERLDSIKHFGIKQNEVSMLERALTSGTPLDDVLTEIKGEIKKDASEWVGFDYGDGIATALEIIDKHIGKAERGET